ncbi:MAG: MaoC family dehydratase [Bryobacteraceae bacterium]|jgi:acyl dehydratase
MDSFRVVARNTAPDSENRIHDDQTAAAYGFRGGLVPGVTVYGYLTVPVIRHFGEDWLARGAMRVRFLQPVYEGDEVVVTLSGSDVAASLADGTVCASAEVSWPEDPPPSPDLYPEAPLPADRPPASPQSLTPGRILGTLYVNLPLADPAALLTLSNHLLMQNVKLGPWIHAASEVRHFSLVRDGELLSVRGRIADRFERKGHRFVVLDILVVAGARPIQYVRHTAIYELRPPASG